MSVGVVFLVGINDVIRNGLSFYHQASNIPRNVTRKTKKGRRSFLRKDSNNDKIYKTLKNITVNPVSRDSKLHFDTKYVYSLR